MSRFSGNRVADYDDVVVAAPVTIPYERFSTETPQWWLSRLLARWSTEHGITAPDIDGLSVTSFGLAPESAVTLTEHFGLSPRWIESVGTGGASGIVAMRRAARAVQMGDASLVACMAGDTNDPSSFARLLLNFSRFTQDAVLPYGFGGANATFAMITDAYMRAYGVTREDFGKLAVHQRDNARKFAHALLKKPLAIEDYLDARVIAEPLRLFDCVMPCAGAEGFLVTTPKIAEELGLPCARILSVIERYNAFADDPVPLRSGWAVDADVLWKQAGLSPSEVDIVETYDDYPVMIAVQFEDLGFCAPGKVADFIRCNSFTLDGSFPHNTSGGQLSCGQPGAAGGFVGIVEGLRQLTGSALGNQVERARRGLVSGFGMVNYDRGLCTAATVLEGLSR